MRLEPGNHARSPSCDYGERHGRTWLAHGEKKDEGANHWAPATLHSRMRDRHHAHHCASTISPRDAEVPSSTQSADEMLWCRVAHNLARLSPVRTNRDAHRIGSRFPLLALGPRSPSSITPDMYPYGMPNIPNGRETSPRIPFPPGRADGSADCLSLHTLVHNRLTVGVKRHSRSTQCGASVRDALSVHHDARYGNMGGICFRFNLRDLN